MILRAVIVYPELRGSAKFARLSWFHRDFFYGLLGVADPKGRFEADIDLLRAALYAPILSKVSKRDVQDALAECHRVGLVELWVAADGRGCGEVVKWRTNLKKIESRLPARPGAPPEPELFSVADPPLLSRDEQKEGRKPPQPPAAAGGADVSDVSGRTARRRSPERQRREATTDLASIEAELESILRPGGCAYNVTPTGEKLMRYEGLMRQRRRLLAALAA